MGKSGKGIFCQDEEKSAPTAQILGHFLGKGTENVQTFAEPEGKGTVGSARNEKICGEGTALAEEQGTVRGDTVIQCGGRGVKGRSMRTIRLKGPSIDTVYYPEEGSSAKDSEEPKPLPKKSVIGQCELGGGRGYRTGRGVLYSCFLLKLWGKSTVVVFSCRSILEMGTILNVFRRSKRLIVGYCTGTFDLRFCERSKK